MKALGGFCRLKLTQFGENKIHYLFHWNCTGNSQRVIPAKTRIIAFPGKKSEITLPPAVSLWFSLRMGVRKAKKCAERSAHALAEFSRRDSGMTDLRETDERL
jgi:hypothetical protein